MVAPSMAMSAELLHVTRGELVETVQRGHLAVVDAHGMLLAHCGDAHTVTYMRSSAKPLQAMMAVRSGAARRFDITGRLLAVCCASHQGEPGHVEAVGAILARSDVSESMLQCGIHPPAYVPAAAALWRAGGEPTPLHNNCSGKHAGMLAAARALGAPLETYLDPAHPVQQGILAAIAALSGVAPERVVLGVDGCSAPVHGLPLSGMARAYAHLAGPTDDAHGYAEPLGTVAAAMTGQPWYVRGTGGPDTLMMERAGGRLVVKSGAEGVLCVGVRGAGVGLAIKVESGRNEGSHAVAIAALRALGLLDEREEEAMGELAAPPVRNHRGLTVGVTRPVLALDV